MVTEKWKELAVKLISSNEFDIEMFKSLFKETWHHFIDSSSLSRHDVEVIRYMSSVPAHDKLPENTPKPVYDACIRVSGSFLDELAFSDPEKPFDSVITVDLDDGSCAELSLDSFDEGFELIVSKLQ